MKIRTGIFSDNYNYESNNDWPANTKMQAGGGSIDNIGKTIFFEAFFEDFYVRGEDLTIEGAENNAWDKYQVYISCEHEFERFSDTSSLGKCKHCQMRKSGMFELLTCCQECGVKNVTHHKDGYFCYKHYMVKLRNAASVSDENSFSLKRNIWINEVLEEINLYENKSDDEIHQTYYSNYSGFFEYMMVSCNTLQSTICEKINKHYVDLYEEIEVNEEVYKAAFRVYLEDNKNHKFKNVEDSRSLLINFIKNNG